MAISKAQIKATTKYVKANYDEIKLRVPKGYKDEIKAEASIAGESVNEYVKTAIDMRIAQRTERITGGGHDSQSATDSI